MISTGIKWIDLDAIQNILIKELLKMNQIKAIHQNYVKMNSDVILKWLSTFSSTSQILVDPSINSEVIKDYIWIVHDDYMTLEWIEISVKVIKIIDWCYFSLSYSLFMTLGGGFASKDINKQKIYNNLTQNKQ